MRYAIVIEKAENNYAAYAPDVPGCAATGATLEESMSKSNSLSVSFCRKKTVYNDLSSKYCITRR